MKRLGKTSSFLSSPNPIQTHVSFLKYEHIWCKKWQRARKILPSYAKVGMCFTREEESRHMKRHCLSPADEPNLQVTKGNEKICSREELCSAAMAACVLASVNLIALVLFPSPSPCSNMIRFTGMSKWVILFVHCSCLDPNITRRIKASESPQEVKQEKRKRSILSLFCLCVGVH